LNEYFSNNQGELNELLSIIVSVIGDFFERTRSTEFAEWSKQAA
jgi:hypothetical protein